MSAAGPTFLDKHTCLPRAHQRKSRFFCIVHVHEITNRRGLHTNNISRLESANFGQRLFRDYLNSISELYIILVEFIICALYRHYFTIFICFYYFNYVFTTCLSHGIQYCNVIIY